ncbi:MAG: penicillin-binding protein activator [Rhodospirillales bacterium]|nr:penicillin-binding protein activator [Rhodospirillales bacterium]
MDRPRSLSAANRRRRIGAAGAALLLLLAGACAAPSVPPPSPEDQPAPRSAAETKTAAPEISIAPADERTQTLAALPTDESTAEKPAEEDANAVSAPEETARAARVGLLLPLSGRYAQEGETLLNAAQLALFDTADERFLLLPRDTGGTASGAERTALALLEEGVDLILGPLFAEGVNTVAAHARAHGVTVVAFSTDRTAAREGVFLLGHTPRTQIRRVFAHAAAKGHRRIALLAPETRYGATVADEAWAAAALNGLSLEKVRNYAADASDAADVVRKLAEYDRRAGALKAERQALARQGDAAARRRLKRLETLDTLGELPFDALLLADGGVRLRQVAPLLPFYDIDPAEIRVLGTGLWEDSATLGEPALAGGWFAGPDPTARRNFEARYQRVFGVPPGAIATLAYDATALAAALARAGASFGPRAIGNRGGFVGADGLFRFDDEGIAERGLAVFEVAGGGKTRVVSPAPARFDTGAGAAEGN